MQRWLAVVCVVLVPQFVSAAVIINEVAWMGTADSANDEWIELYNSGSGAISVSGWELSDDKNLSITLEGVINAGSYAVLERTDDSSVPGTAFLVYTGAIANTGATLSLRDESGTIVDRVVGGEDWENIGGDNVTKETAQYFSSGWRSSESTPGRANVYDPVVEDNEDEEESQAYRSSGVSTPTASKSKTVLSLPDADLQITLDLPEKVYVNQPVTFSASGSGIGDTLLDSLVYAWNFGDLRTGSGQTVTHRYDAPGEYVVVTEASYARHQQSARQTVTVLPVSVSLSRSSDGTIMVHNDSLYEIDLSGYRLVGAGPLRFPPHTYVLPKATIKIAPERIGAISGSNVTLYDQSNNSVASLLTPTPRISALSYSEDFVSAAPQQLVAARNPAVTERTQKVSDAFTFASSSTVSDAVVVTEVEADLQPVNTASVIEATDTMPKPSWPYLGFAGLLMAGIFAVYGSGRRK